MVGTRTTVQVRSHAQKYEMKVEKDRGLLQGGLSMATAVDSEARPSRIVSAGMVGKLARHYLRDRSTINHDLSFPNFQTCLYHSHFSECNVTSEIKWDEQEGAGRWR